MTGGGTAAQLLQVVGGVRQHEATCGDLLLLQLQLQGLRVHLLEDSEVKVLLFGVLGDGAPDHLLADVFEEGRDDVLLESGEEDGLLVELLFQES